jgi:hypothetical protein
MSRSRFSLCAIPPLPAFGVSLPLAAQLCPPCNTDVAPLPGGHGSSSDGRRITNVYIDNASAPSGWGNPVPTALSTAVQQALDMWNDTTDQFGNKTCYFLQTTTSLGANDIGIEPATTASGGCGDNNAQQGGRPETIHITRSLVTTYANNIGQLRGLIGHEIGHSLGLAESPSACAEGSSIMTGYFAGSVCVQRSMYLQASDIAKSNQNCTNRASCDTTASGQESEVVPNPTCLSSNSCQQQSFYGIPGDEPDLCGYPGNSGCPDYLISVQGAYGTCCTPAYSPVLIDVGGSGFDLTDARGGSRSICGALAMARRSRWPGRRPER